MSDAERKQRTDPEETSLLGREIPLQFTPSRSIQPRRLSACTDKRVQPKKSWHSRGSLSLSFAFALPLPWDPFLLLMYPVRVIAFASIPLGSSTKSLKPFPSLDHTSTHHPALRFSREPSFRVISLSHGLLFDGPTPPTFDLQSALPCAPHVTHHQGVQFHTCFKNRSRRLYLLSPPARRRTQSLFVLYLATTNQPLLTVQPLSLTFLFIPFPNRFSRQNLRPQPSHPSKNLRRNTLQFSVILRSPPLYALIVCASRKKKKETSPQPVVYCMSGKR